MAHSTPVTDTTGSTALLHVALELSRATWKLAFLAQAGRPRIRTIDGGDIGQLETEVGKAKRRLKLPADTPVVSCYEAGRDGFWVHRMLERLGISNVVVDPASIEVERRKRRRKTDRLDAAKLVTRLVRHHAGERDFWSIVRVPTEEQEDARRLHRERERLLKEKKQHISRILGLMATQGPVAKKLSYARWQRWDGQPLPAELRAELEREQERLDLVVEQLKHVDAEQRRRIKEQQSQQLEQIRKLTSLRGIGPKSAWLLVMEIFGWRPYQNRRTASSLIGLTGTPYDSGGSDREQGISKAGNRRIRALIVELSWLWLRYQPQSELSLWFQRFADSGRMRRVGIVAVARRLFVQLWRFVDHGAIPPGALLKTA